MAFFSFSTAFDIAALDFSPYYGPGHLTVTLPGQTFEFPELELPLPGGSVTVPGAEFSVPDIVGVALGGDILAVGGTGLAATPKGFPTGGTISYLGMNGAMAFLALGLSIDGAAYAAAAKTASTADDRALFQAEFAGNDLIYLSDGADRINTGAGRDLVTGAGGSDTLMAGAGNDFVIGGGGGDRSYGGLGNDLLLDLDGANFLYGGDGRDVLVGGSGKDRMTGGDGADRFVFKPGDGKDVVTDFQDGTDRIAIMVPGIKFGDLNFDVVGDGVKIGFGAGSVTLLHLAAGALSKADFILGSTAPLEAALGEFFNGWDYA